MDSNKQPTFANGKLCYVELPAMDITVSATFYHNCFGWKIRQSSEGETSFDDTVVEVSGRWVTGRKPSTDVGLLLYIMVDSVEVTLEKIIANEGIIVQPIGMDAPEITARFTDPAGNIMGLYQHPHKE